MGRKQNRSPARHKRICECADGFRRGEVILRILTAEANIIPEQCNSGVVRGVPLRLGGPETVCHCLEQAVRGGPKRTGVRTFAQNRAVWERNGFSRRPCRRLGAPASVASTPAGPLCHAHGCPRGSDIRRLVCPCFVVRRHGLQPAVSDYGGPPVKHGQPCGRRGNLLAGRSDRILPRQERSSHRPPPACPAGAEVLLARRTAFPRHVRPQPALWSAAIHCRFGTARERGAPRTSHLSLRFPHRPKRR